MLLVLPGAVSAGDQATIVGDIAQPAPTAAFTASPLKGAAPLTVTFTDQSTVPIGTIDSWKWEYNAGTGWVEFSHEQNPTYSFPAGYYDIRLTVSNSGGSDEEVKTNYIRVSPGPLPVTTKQSGTVSGDLYFSAVQPTPFNSQPQHTGVTQEATFEFTSSGYTTIEYARLYTMIYVAGTDNRECVASVSFDGDNDGTYETVLENDVTLNTESETNGNVYWQGDHINRVYSDYVMFYDVKDYIAAGTVRAKVQTKPGASNMDGRIKYLALVVAYNDGDSDQVKYWINDGHHWTSPANGQTTYDTSALTTGILDAQLRMVHTSSTDASYAFNSVPKPGANPPSGTYFGVNTWDVKSELPAALSTLAWTKSSGSHKLTMAMLKVSYSAPTADFTATPTAGDRPLTVQFTDTSTGSVTSWAWDFDNDGSVDSTEQNPSYQYTTSGYKTVKLTVTGPLGSDDEVKTNYIHVKEPAPVADFTADKTSGPAPLTVQFTDTSTGVVNSWAWDFDNNGVVDSNTQNPSWTYSTPGIYTVKLTVTGPDYSDDEIKEHYITVGTPTITITVTPDTVSFGQMVVGDNTGSTQVTVTTEGGTAWSVTATATNNGYMKDGTKSLAQPFQLANGGGEFQAMTSPFTGFMTGSPDEDRTDTANVKQVRSTGDQPGSYSITLTFTGTFV